jgi:hypothetical protein
VPDESESQFPAGVMVRKDHRARQMVVDGKFWKSGHESACTRTIKGGSMSYVTYMGGW